MKTKCDNCVHWDNLDCEGYSEAKCLRIKEARKETVKPLQGQQELFKIADKQRGLFDESF